MPDIEKVIKGLECCSVENDWNCNDCPYGNPNVPISECIHPLLTDAVALLKRREPVKAIKQGDDSYLCDNCEETVGWEEMKRYGFEKVKYKYCPYCGTAVKWDE